MNKIVLGNDKYEILKKDRIVKEDRVHPTELGQHYMAKIFMREMGINAHTENFVLDGINKERYKLEQDLRHIDFVEWNLMLEERLKRKMTHAEKIGFAKKKLAEAKEKINDERISEVINSFKDSSDLKYLNVIMRDFLDINKCEEIINLNNYKGNFNIFNCKYTKLQAKNILYLSNNSAFSSGIHQ